MTDVISQSLAAIASGGLVGFTLGLIGGGGSILATPLLLYVVGVSQPHVAIGTGALAVSINAYANLIGHARKGHVWWRCATVFATTGTIGALAGSSLGKAFDGRGLLFLFGLLMLIVAALMLRPRATVASDIVKTDRMTCWKTAAVALGAGAASGFFGIGGGFLIVPGLMLSTSMPMISAVGSSLLAVGTFGLATALNYAVSGLVDWTVAAQFISGGVIGGLGGMLLATRLATKRNLLNRIFAVLIIVVAFYVLYKNSIAASPL
ncbi:MAG: sulfite exporter TauE/SafE family protein [Rhizobiaceae bacterium]|nr:sulfite exporter TauE/SafE family protein [Rhizobiaceae bacterium]